MKNLQSKISTKRHELGLTLEEVGKAVGVTKSTVMKWENGEILNIKGEKIGVLAKTLNVNPAWLMGWVKNPSPSAKVKEIDILCQKIHRRNQLEVLVNYISDMDDTELDFLFNMAKYIKGDI